jgi:hypothetical protein
MQSPLCGNELHLKLASRQCVPDARPSPKESRGVSYSVCDLRGTPELVPMGCAALRVDLAPVFRCDVSESHSD